MYNVYVYCYIYIVYTVYTAVYSAFCVRYLLFQDLYTLLPVLLYTYYPTTTIIQTHSHYYPYLYTDYVLKNTSLLLKTLKLSVH